MANNKIQLSDGTVLLDLSNDTVTDASHIMSGRVGHLANGLQVTGTGVNCPVFTLNFDANNNITSVTCNKTFNECLTLADNGEYAAIVQESHSGDISTTYGISVYSDYDTELYILYSYIHIYTALNDILADIRYTASGIQIISPSETLGEVNTPTAAKGSVSNHSINVTPSVTYTGGWIDSGSKTGSAVTVSASELVSGNKAITSNGDNIDVTNYATVSVNVSSGGTAAISVVDTTDSHGGTVRTITALDISDTTAVASDVAQGKYFYTAQGVKTAGTGSGGGPSATQHTIYFEFSDETDTTITAYYDSTFISDAITATTPTTYGQKTVTLAQLDGVTWYEYDPSETWETLIEGNISYEPDTPYPYCWISDLGSVTIPMGSVWRITFNNIEYRCTVTQTASENANSGLIGNPLYDGGTDDGSGVPFSFFQSPWGAWSGGADVSGGASIPVKIERLVTS